MRDIPQSPAHSASLPHQLVRRTRASLAHRTWYRAQMRSSPALPSPRAHKNGSNGRQQQALHHPRRRRHDLLAQRNTNAMAPEDEGDFVKCPAVRVGKYMRREKGSTHIYGSSVLFQIAVARKFLQRIISTTYSRRNGTPWVGSISRTTVHNLRARIRTWCTQRARARSGYTITFASCSHLARTVPSPRIICGAPARAGAYNEAQPTNPTVWRPIRLEIEEAAVFANRLQEDKGCGLGESHRPPAREWVERERGQSSIQRGFGR
ncbi:hypothetical protein B0H16DRAFT_1696246 [Mycena metata]|uniref:Uncharacterized protein n=1 Tax=Mycena metata TaxID=1033252 RepID=A0AAD7I1R7_9AGAR|nr:hypothetical protein B0H16DRAFT_1696246 [Mycena metata]